MRISDWSSDVCSSDLSGEKDAPAFCGAGNAGAFRHIISRTRPWAWAIEHPLRGGERPFLYIRRTRVTDGAPAFAGATAMFKCCFPSGHGKIRAEIAEEMVRAGSFVRTRQVWIFCFAPNDTATKKRSRGPQDHFPSIVAPWRRGK